MAKRTKVVVAGAVIAVAIAVIVGWRVHRKNMVPIGFVVAMQALDDGAVLAWRAGDENPDGRHGYVSRVDVHGHTLWWARVPDDPLTGDSLAVGDGIVAVRYSHHTAQAVFGDDQSLVAFALADGRPLWDRKLATVKPFEGLHAEASLNLYSTAAFVGDRLLEWVDRDKDGSVIDVIAPQTGSVVAERPWSNDAAMTVVVGQRLVQHESLRAVSLDVPSAKADVFDTRGNGCAIDGDYVTIEGQQQQATLVAYAGGDRTKRRLIKDPFDPRPPGSSYEWWMLRSCGRYRDRLVFSLDANTEQGRTDRLVVIASRTGDILHVITLPHDSGWDGEAMARKYYDHASLAGELTRFVPYIVIAHDGDNELRQLVMLDLEQGTIAWSSQPDDKLLDAHLFRGTDRWYLVSGHRGCRDGVRRRDRPDRRGGAGPRVRRDRADQARAHRWRKAVGGEPGARARRPRAGRDLRRALAATRGREQGDSR